MRGILISLALVAMTGAQAAGYTPDADVIAKLEASINPAEVPVRGIHMLSVPQYARFYAGVMIGGQPMIVGEFVSAIAARRAAGIYQVADEKQMPVIYDGGCSVVHVLYDVRASRVVFIRCQGVA